MLTLTLIVSERINALNCCKKISWLDKCLNEQMFLLEWPVNANKVTDLLSHKSSFTVCTMSSFSWRPKLIGVTWVRLKSGRDCFTHEQKPHSNTGLHATLNQQHVCVHACVCGWERFRRGFGALVALRMSHPPPYLRLRKDSRSEKRKERYEM